MKTHISIRIDAEILDKLRELAEAQEIGYQTLINRILAEAVYGKKNLELTAGISSK